MLEVDQRRLTTHSCPPGVKKAATSSASSNNSSGSSSSSSNSSKSSMLNERSCTTGHSKVRSRSHTHVTKSYGEGPRSPLRSLNNGDSSSSSKSGGSSSKQHQGVGNSNNNGSHNNHLHHHHHHQHGGAGGGTRHRPRGAIRASSTERRDASLSVLNLLNKSAALCRLSEELRIGYSSSEGHRHSSSSSAPFPSSSPCAYHGCNNNSSSRCGGRACSAHMPNSYRTYQDIAAWASEVTLGSRDLESRGKLNTSSYPSSFSEPSPDAAISTRTFSSSKKRNTNNKTNRNVNTYEEQSAITPPNEQCLHPTRPCWSSNRSQTASTAAAAADHHYATHSTNNWSPSSPLTSWLDHQSPSSVCVSGLSGLSGVSSSGVSPMSVSPAPCRTSGRPSGNNSAYHHYYLRRQQRSRKFRFNLFMYSALYRKQKRMDNNYLIYHNPMEDPDATYTSFSNPNYFFNQPHRLRSHHSHSSNPDDNNSQENGHHLSNNNNHNHSNNNNNEDDDDVTNEDGLNNKSRTTSISNSFSSSMDGASNRLSLGKLELDPDYYEGHNGAFSDYSSCEPTPTTPDRTLILQKLNSPSDDDDDDELENEIEEDGDDEGGDDDDDDNEEAEQRKGLLSTEKKSKSRSNSNSSGGSSVGGAKAPKGEYVDDEPRVYFGVGSTQSKKSRGILGYLEMLEQQAREREAMLEVGVDERFGERKKEDEEDDGEDDRDGDGEDEEGPKVEQEGEQHVEPPGEENFHGTEINSPDSHDSGIQTGEKTPILSPATPGTNMPPSMEKGDPVVGSGSEEEGEGEVLPEGWQKHENEDGPYYWHVKSGTIQRDPPPPAPPDGPALCSPRSISMASDSGSSSSASIPSTPGSVGSSTERHLAEFEGHALQYAAKSLQSLSSRQASQKEGSSERCARFSVRSLGWVRIAEEDLTPERSSKAVNKCIVDLSLGRNDINDAVGRWGDGKDLMMELDHVSLRLVDPVDGVTLNSQPIHSIRVWGVGRDNGRERDFAYVARDRVTKLHMCHVFHCDTLARHIANTLRDICKKIMLERSLHQSAVARLSRPTDLPNLDKVNHPNGEKLSFQNLYNNARFPTPMEEPRKVMRCHYLGVQEVMRPTGRDILNEAIQYLYYRIPPEKWKFVNVAIAPSTITITEHGNPDGIIEECRVRFLSFMGIAVDNVKLCAFIMHTSQNKFLCHVFHSEPSAGPMCKTIEAACKLRYQKCLDAHPQTPKGGLQGKSLSSSIKQSIQCVWGSVTQLASPK